MQDEFKALKQHIVESLTPKVEVVEPVNEGVIEDAMHQRWKEHVAHRLAAKALSCAGLDCSHHDERADEILAGIKTAANVLKISAEDLGYGHNAAHEELHKDLGLN